MKVELIGVSQNILRIRRLIDQIADTRLNTIIFGETGVGKELIAECLYDKSNRNGKPFIKVNCAALPDTLLESEMFGYERGAFTGAERRKRGKFEQAHGCSPSCCTCCKAVISHHWALKNRWQPTHGLLRPPITNLKRTYKKEHLGKTCIIVSVLLKYISSRSATGPKISRI